MSITAMSMRPLAGLFLVQNRTITSRLWLISRGNFSTAVSLLALNVSYACATGLNAVLSIGKAFTASERMVSHVSRNALRIAGSYC